MHDAPRHFLTRPDLPGAGLPHDRASRLAARHAFVGLKRDFAEAVADMPGSEGEWLRRQVRAAEEPIDLFLLRAAVFAALRRSGEPSGTAWRHSLRRSLDTLFPDTGLAPATGFGAF